MQIKREGYDFLKSARWLSFLECTALGLQLNLSIISDNGTLEFQSSRTCPVCQQNQNVNYLPVLSTNDFRQETIDLRDEDTVIVFPLGPGLKMLVKACLCKKGTVHPALNDRASLAAKLLTNFLTSFKKEYHNGQRTLELSIIRQMNHIVLSLFHGDTNALKRSFELILSALVILLDAEGSWVQVENGETNLFIRGDKFLVNAYLNSAEGLAQQVDINYAQFKCKLGVLTPCDNDHATELMALMSQECAIILEIDNLFRLLNNQLARVLGGVNSAIFLIDQRRNITYLNKATEKLFNQSFVDLVGVSMLNVDGPWVSVINAGITFSVNGQMESLKTDGDENNSCWVDWQVSPILEEKVIVGWLVMVDDRSDYYRWQSAARKAERFATTSMLVGTLAHELRNPLSAAYGLLQLMARKRDPEQTRAYVSLATREIERVTRLLNEFLLLGKPASIETEPLDLVSFIEELLPLLEGEAIGTEILVLFDAEKVAHVRVDSGQLTQVILNLVRNAVQSLSDSNTGIVTIALHQVNDKVAVSIQDNGQGFAPGVKERLFTPFFTTKERGTGLGLAVVQAIIHNHDGEIEASNVPQGGACFTFTLPISSIKEKVVDIALIVNDRIFSYSLERALKALNNIVKVIEMSDFENGINCIGSIEPRIVIIEELPGNNQLIRIDEINRMWPGVNTLVLGDFSQETIMEFKEKGIKTLKRPLEITQIISTINNIRNNNILRSPNEIL